MTFAQLVFVRRAAMSFSATTSSSSLSPPARWFSLLECAFGVFVVVGHNIFHFLPNEVPILFILGWISLRWRNGGWKYAGLRRPQSWWKTIALAMVAAAILLLGSELIVEPLSHRIWPGPEHVSHIIQSGASGWRQALVGLLIVWTFASFGEEMSYRGYLLTRASEVLGRSSLAYWAAMILVSLLFGFGHYYKGPSGVVDSAYSGLALGAAYLLAGRNLWVPILAHGAADTVAIFVVFIGWAH
ncbi:MAG TPA: CPBP family intramembrane glutamic endopeptidase [Candidatus Udaeobacter sp.]|nr:CPBP family intramembrane glutamic endopeptidase [Candidatus Udaeobacter sp.]